jgi:outer membrane protein assembly factor BamE (lipoprotein component of BamABCDE complex)
MRLLPDPCKPSDGPIDGRDRSRARRAALQRTGLWLGAAILMLAACSETVIKHGHQFQENDLKSISTGMSQEQVKTTLGTPTTTAVVGSGSAFYYISSTQGQTSFFKPVEKDRKVLAVYFDQLGSVDRVAHYGIKDGKVFDYARQKTPTPAKDESLLKALFRNLGAKQFGGD